MPPQTRTTTLALKHAESLETDNVVGDPAGLSTVEATRTANAWSLSYPTRGVGKLINDPSAGSPTERFQGLDYI